MQKELLYKFHHFINSFAANTHISPKVASSLAIVILALVAIKIFDALLFRWEKRLLSKLGKARLIDASSFETRIIIIRKIINAGIFFIAFMFFLMQFEAVRHIGTALLASAGLASIVIGLAAQSTLSNIIAGISVSFSQPVRLNDAVIFKNDFGWIEEISLMHTTIRTWDNRRIVIPNSVLANEVIENWTIKDPALLGTVMLYVDYACDIDKVRKWVQEIVNNSSYSTPEKLAVVQAVDFTEKSMALRVLAKGPDAPDTWNLRCELREELIKKFKDENMPLPRIRITGDSNKKTPA